MRDKYYPNIAGEGTEAQEIKCFTQGLQLTKCRKRLEAKGHPAQKSGFFSHTSLPILRSL